MNGFEEVLGAELGLQFLDYAVVDQHRAQKSGFRLDVGGQRTRFAGGTFDEKIFLSHKRRTMVSPGSPRKRDLRRFYSTACGW